MGEKIIKRRRGAAIIETPKGVLVRERPVHDIDEQQSDGERGVDTREAQLQVWGADGLLPVQPGDAGVPRGAVYVLAVWDEPAAGGADGAFVCELPAGAGEQREHGVECSDGGPVKVCGVLRAGRFQSDAEADGELRVPMGISDSVL